MMSLSKKNKIGLFMLALVLFSFNGYCLASSLENPDLSQAASVLVRALNLGIISVGIVLIGMIAYGAYKAAMSLGDPRALQGAKDTWIYAFFGAAVVLFFLIIGNLALRAMGVSTFSLDISSIVSQIMEAINALLTGIVTGN